MGSCGRLIRGTYIVKLSNYTRKVKLILLWVSLLDKFYQTFPTPSERYIVPNTDFSPFYKYIFEIFCLDCVDAVCMTISMTLYCCHILPVEYSPYFELQKRNSYFWYSIGIFCQYLHQKLYLMYISVHLFQHKNCLICVKPTGNLKTAGIDIFCKRDLNFTVR